MTPPPKQLPLDIRNFTGRAELIAALDSILAERDAPGADFARIAVIVGTAGVGKTALATHWAHRIADRFPDGQIWLDLHGYDPEQSMKPGHALGVLLRALGVTGSSMPPDTESRAGLFRSLMAGRRVLLVLDNVGSADQARQLLPGGAGCLVLVTSRDNLAGLVARDGATRLRVDLFDTEESVALLRRLIGARVVDAHEADVRTMVTLCARLPLALRIVADRLDGATADRLTALVAELSEMTPLDTFTIGGDTRSAMRAVFFWSYRALPTDAAALFRRLGLLPLPNYDDHVTAAIMDTSPTEARRLLDVLADAHLVESRGPGRAHVHDLLRAFATEQVQTEDSDAGRHAVVERVLNHYSQAVAKAVALVFPHEEYQGMVSAPTVPAPSFPDSAAALSWLDAHWAHVLAMVTHAAAKGWFAHVTQLATMLYRYLMIGAHHGDALAVHGHAVAAAEDRAGVANATHNLGSTYWLLGQHGRARDHYQRALDIFREIQDGRGIARALGNLGNVYWRLGHNDDAYQCYQEAWAIFVERQDVLAQAMTLVNLSELHVGWGQYEIAFRHSNQALELYRTMDDQVGEAHSRKLIGDVHLRYGRYSDARAEYDATLDISRRLGHNRIVAYALDGLGGVCARQQAFDRAVALHEEALSVRRECGDRFGEIDTLCCLGFARHGRGDLGLAAGHYRNALISTRELGSRGPGARLLNGLGELATATSAPDKAVHHHGEALELARQLGDRYEQARAWQGLADAHAALGNEKVSSEQGAIAATMRDRLRVPGSATVRARVRPADGSRDEAG